MKMNDLLLLNGLAWSDKHQSFSLPNVHKYTTRMIFYFLQQEYKIALLNSFTNIITKSFFFQDTTSTFVIVFGVVPTSVSRIAVSFSSLLLNG
jgi:hypothetical protein